MRSTLITWCISLQSPVTGISKGLGAFHSGLHYIKRPIPSQTRRCGSVNEVVGGVSSLLCERLSVFVRERGVCGGITSCGISCINIGMGF